MGSRRSSKSVVVSGEVVERAVPVARPVAPRKDVFAFRDVVGSSARVDVVHRHVYEGAPPAPAAPVVPARRVPMWAIVVGYFAGIVGIVMLILALSSGPIIQPPHPPARHQSIHQSGGSR